MTFLLDGAYVPFTFALALLFGLFTLEAFVGLLGGTFLGLGGDTEIDLDVAEIGLGDIDGLDLDGLDVNATDLADLADADVEADLVSADLSLAAWLGLGRVPFLIWFASLLIGFGLSGLAIQVAWQSVLGFALPIIFAVPAALVIGIAWARQFSGLFARILPKTGGAGVW
ncbi:MAG: hypothetical protein AAF198_11705 [Pseudomonadota bacterium]